MALTKKVDIFFTTKTIEIMELNRKITLIFLIPWLLFISTNKIIANNNFNLPTVTESTMKNNTERLNYNYQSNIHISDQDEMCEMLSSRLQFLKDLEHYTVFNPDEDSYNIYRIPSIVQARDGTLIAIVEARRDTPIDSSTRHTDMVYKLSHDGGRSWSSLRILEKSKEGWSASNPTAVVKSSSGRIMVLYSIWKPGRDSKNSRPGTLDNQLWMRYSDDNGNTWSEAVDITHQARDFDNWGNVVFGPGHGIETRTGRLVIPSYSQIKTDSYFFFTLYSDDGGRSWRRGKKSNINANESQIVELDDGRLMIDSRQGEGTSLNHIGTRWTAISKNQGETWGELKQGQVCPKIGASIIRYPRPDNSNNSLLLWSGLKGPGRINLILRLSSDQGQSFPIELLISPGPAAYSVMSLIDKGDVGILWEGGEHRSEKIIFTRIPMEVIMNLELLSTVNRDVH